MISQYHVPGPKEYAVKRWPAQAGTVQRSCHVQSNRHGARIRIKFPLTYVRGIYATLHTEQPNSIGPHSLGFILYALMHLKQKVGTPSPPPEDPVLL
jgi:hypothetical protein